MKNILIVIIVCLLSCPVYAQSKDYWTRQYFSFSYPLKNIHITSPYGWRTSPITKKGREFHKGLDLRASIGTEVYSVMDGIVIKVTSDNRSGRYVTIKYNDISVSYCHLSHTSVKVGDNVNAGEIIGLSGNTGRALKGGPHLHITLKYKGEVVDPLLLLYQIKIVKNEAITNLLIN